MLIAFRRYNKNSLLDRIIRFATKSDFVHCALVSVKNKTLFYGYSSFMTGGVKSGWFGYDPDEWEFINLEGVTASHIKAFFEETKGRGYDYLGILGFIFGNPDNPKRYFCSEWCAEALMLNEPSSFSPGSLYNYIKENTGSL